MHAEASRRANHWHHEKDTTTGACVHKLCAARRLGVAACFASISAARARGSTKMPPQTQQEVATIETNPLASRCKRSCEVALPWREGGDETSRLKQSQRGDAVRTQISTFTGCRWHSGPAASAPRAVGVRGARPCVGRARARRFIPSAAEADVPATVTSGAHPRPRCDLPEELRLCDVRLRLEDEERGARKQPDRSSKPANPLRRLIENLQPGAKSKPAGRTIAGVKDHDSAIPAERAKRDTIVPLRRLFDGSGGSAYPFEARAARLCVLQVSVAYSISPPGRGHDDIDGAMKDKTRTASGSHYCFRAHGHRAMSEVTRAAQRRRRARAHRHFFFAASSGPVEAMAIACSAKTAAGDPRNAIGAILGREGTHPTVGSAAYSQAFGSIGIGVLNLSWLDEASREVHNFHAKRGVKGTEAGARRADQRDAAVEAALAQGRRGQNMAVRPIEAGVHRGAELQMGQLVAHIRRKPKGRIVARVGELRALLPLERRDMLTVSLVRGAARSYLKFTGQRLERMKPEQRSPFVLKFGGGGGGGGVERGRAASRQVGCDAAHVFGARLRCGAESVEALQHVQNRGAGRDAGPETIKELELY